MNLLLSICAILALTVELIFAQNPKQILYTSYAIDEQTGEEKTVFQSATQYDNQGRARTNTYYYFNEQQKRLGPSYRVETKYNEAGQEIYSKTIYYKDYTDTINSTRIISSQYLPDGKLLEYKVTETYLNNPLIYESFFNYTYSAAGCTQRIDQRSTTSNGSENGYYILYTVDSRCRITLTQFIPVTPDYLPSFTAYEFSGDNLISQRAYSINAGDTSLVSENLNFYNDKNLLVAQQQTNYYRTEYEYDENNRVIRSRNFNWNNESKLWSLNGENTIEYDANGRMIYQRGDYVGFTFITEMEYDNAGRNTRSINRAIYTSQGFIEYVNETLNYFRCDGAVISSESYNLNSGSHRLSSYSKIMYLQPADCEPLKEQPLVIFPNPTTGPVTLLPDQPLESYQLKVYNDVGQLVHEQKFEVPILPATLNFVELPPGTYVISVSGNSFYASTRLIRN